MNATEARIQTARQMRIALTFDLARIQLEELREFCGHSERWTRKAQRDFRERAEKHLRLADPYDEGRQIMVESFAEDMDQLEKTFQNLLRNSLLMQSCASFEHGLVKVARCFEGGTNPNFMGLPNDAGNKKAQSFLKKFDHLDFPDRTETWMDILKVCEVRNVVVHANGIVLEKPKHTKQVKHRESYEALQARWPDELALDRSNQMTFSAAFIPRVLDLFEAFLRDLQVAARAALR